MLSLSPTIMQHITLGIVLMVVGGDPFELLYLLSLIPHHLLQSIIIRVQRVNGEIAQDLIASALSPLSPQIDHGWVLLGRDVLE